MNEFHEVIVPHLQTAISQTIQQVRPWGKATSWSAVYRLDLTNGTHVFVKRRTSTVAGSLPWTPKDCRLGS